MTGTPFAQPTGLGSFLTGVPLQALHGIPLPSPTALEASVIASPNAPYTAFLQLLTVPRELLHADDSALIPDFKETGRRKWRLKEILGKPDPDLEEFGKRHNLFLGPYSGKREAASGETVRYFSC